MSFFGYNGDIHEARLATVRTLAFDISWSTEERAKRYCVSAHCAWASQRPETVELAVVAMSESSRRFPDNLSLAASRPGV